MWPRIPVLRWVSAECSAPLPNLRATSSTPWIVKREEFEVVKAMAQKAREENDALKAKLAELEAKLGR